MSSKTIRYFRELDIETHGNDIHVHDNQFSRYARSKIQIEIIEFQKTMNFMAREKSIVFARTPNAQHTKPYVRICNELI